MKNGLSDETEHTFSTQNPCKLHTGTTSCLIGDENGDMVEHTRHVLGQNHFCSTTTHVTSYKDKLLINAKSHATVTPINMTTMTALP
jgi:hypothetical protein